LVVVYVLIAKTVLRSVTAQLAIAEPLAAQVGLFILLPAVRQYLLAAISAAVVPQSMAAVCIVVKEVRPC
jgi:hypothetical protein